MRLISCVVSALMCIGAGLPAPGSEAERVAPTPAKDGLVEIVTINAIQGSGETSPLADTAVDVVDVVVTAVGTNGFTIQTPAGSLQDDGDPDTSEGLWVYAGGVPTVAPGDIVSVSGLVQEYYGMTEINASVVTVTGRGVGDIPDPILFDATVPSPDPLAPSCAIEYECYEGMLVQAAGVVVGPTQSFGSDPVGEFYAVATPNRTFREIGAEYPPLPGVPGTVPIYDGNPEIFEVDADRLGFPPVSANAGDTYTAVGPLGYEFYGWEIWASEAVVVTPGLPVPRAVREPVEGEFTVASLNLYALYDTVDDPTNPNDPVIDPAEYELRLTKHRRAILDVLQAPDVLAVQEAENIDVLNDLAQNILSADPSVHYTAYLVESIDYSGRDNGYLLRDSVDSAIVTQLGAGEIMDFPSILLHDRPPLLLECEIDGRALAVLNVHLRSMVDNDDADDFVRRKRLQQSTSVADMVQDHQSTSSVPMVIVGDFNAFEFTDGYVDVIGQIRGEVDPDETWLTEPTVTDPLLRDEMLHWLPAEDRYSYVYEGTAQVFDHALSTTTAQPLISGFAYGRCNTDAPEYYEDDAGTAATGSDHDGLVVYFLPALFTDGFESGDTGAWSTTNP